MISGTRISEYHLISSLSYDSHIIDLIWYDVTWHDDDDDKVFFGMAWYGIWFGPGFGPGLRDPRQVTFYWTFYLTYFFTFYLAFYVVYLGGIYVVEVRRDTLWSGARGWRLAGNTLIRSLRCRSGGEHFAPEVAVRVPRGTLRSAVAVKVRQGTGGEHFKFCQRLLFGSGGEHCDLALAV